MSEVYEVQARAELAAWKRRILKKPGLLGDAARAVQGRINRAIPEKVHAVITGVIEQMTRGIMTGADITTSQPLIGAGLEEREARVREKIALYRTTAAAEGGVAGAGGFLLAAVDFPALIGLKVKLLFDIAALYGHSGDLPAERLYILQIFQLAFSSPDHRHAIYEAMTRTGSPPVSLEDFDWRKFQQEYRDHIDLAKLLQLVPLIGAPVGAVVNYALVDKLGETAMNAYRMRIFS